MERLRTPKEIGDLLGVSASTVYRLVKDHGLPAVTPGADLRFRVEDVDAWLESRRVA